MFLRRALVLMRIGSKRNLLMKRQEIHLQNNMEINQDVVNIALTSIIAVAGWALRVVWDSVKALQGADKELTKELSEIKTLVKGDYVRREEFDHKFSELTKAIFTKLDKISDKIDGKEDRR
jgi:BMFP domain-containing protein YqiC